MKSNTPHRDMVFLLIAYFLLALAAFALGFRIAVITGLALIISNQWSADAD